MRKIKLILIVMISFMLLMSSCNEAQISVDEHQHTYESTYSFDGECHWKGATCEHVSETKDYAPHQYGEWVVTKPASESEVGSRKKICKVCYNEFVEEIPVISLEFQLNKDQGSYAVTGIGTMNSKEIVIPSTYQNLPVTEIGVSAFANCSNIESVVLPKSVVKIGPRAFYECSLKKINLPNGIQEIGHSAFYGCVNLFSISIPKSVTTIGAEAFYNCYRLVELFNYSQLNLSIGFKSNGYLAYYAKVIHNQEEPSSLITTEDGNQFIIDSEGRYYYLSYEGDKTEIVLPADINGQPYIINTAAFYNFDQLKSVVISDGVKSIEEKAFYRCKSLETITIPQSIESIGKEAFYQCCNLTDIALLNKIVKIEEYSFFDCEKLKNVTIPKGVTEVGDYAFAGCSSIESMKLPDGVLSIGEGVFFNCHNLKTVELPDSIKQIGEYIFSCCEELQCNEYDNGLYLGNEANPHLVLLKANDLLITSIKINENTRFIGTNAFSGCQSLKNIIIPKQIIGIGKGIFRDCSSLEKLSVPFVGERYDKPKNSYIGFLFGAASHEENQVYVPRSLKSVTISGGQSIGKSAFHGCQYLECVKLPNSVVLIEDEAFRYCSNLREIDLGNSVTRIGRRAFQGCFHLTSITFPKSLNKIDIAAFYECYRLIEIYNYSSIKKLYNAKIIHTKEEASNILKTDDGYVFFKNQNNEYYLIDYVGTETKLVLPASIDQERYGINDYAFYNLTDVTSIEIPGSVISIGDYAFDMCSSLVFNKYRNGYYLGNNSNPYLAFIKLVSVDSSDGVIHPDTKFIYSLAFVSGFLINSITIPENVIRIGYGAFDQCFIGSITIPNSVISIGDNAFCNCDNLTSVTIPSSVEYIGNCAFFSCDNLSKVIIESGVKSIGGQAFAYCEKITEVIIPNSVENIEGNAFLDCRGIKRIVISNSISIIKKSTFNGCSNLTSIVIPDGVISLDEYAFSECSKLESVVIPTSVTSIERSVFYLCSNIKDVFYAGTAEDWSKINVDANYNSELLSANRYYYSETQPTKSGNYWHYVDGVVTKW